MAECGLPGGKLRLVGRPALSFVEEEVMRKRVLIPVGVLLGVVILTTVIGLYSSKEADKTSVSYQNDTTYTAEKIRSYGGILERLRSYDAHKLRSVFSDVQSNHDIIPEGYSGLPDSIGYVERFYLNGQPHSRGWFAFFDHRTSNMIPVGKWRYYDVSGREYKRFYPFHHGGDSLRQTLEVEINQENIDHFFRMVARGLH